RGVRRTWRLLVYADDYGDQPVRERHSPSESPGDRTKRVPGPHDLLARDLAPIERCSRLTRANVSEREMRQRVIQSDSKPIPILSCPILLEAPPPEIATAPPGPHRDVGRASESLLSDGSR